MSCLAVIKVPAPAEIYTLSLHDALPISTLRSPVQGVNAKRLAPHHPPLDRTSQLFISGDRLFSDRKSTRLNSSHANISYAVFYLKKKSIQLAHTRDVFVVDPRGRPGLGV